jgi:hypothetical protein
MRSTEGVGRDGAGDEGLETMRGRAAVAGLLFVTSLGIAPSSEALAQPRPSASKSDDAQTQQARRLYTDGLKEAERGKWESARDLFAQAFRLKPHVQIAFNLGQAEVKLGRHLEAAEHLAFFLRERRNIPDDDRRTARQMLDEAQRQIGTLVITVDRPEAEIWVDGASVGRAPLNREVFVAPGRRVIEARVDGVRPASQVRTVKPGDYLRVELKLVKVEAGRPAPVSVPTAPDVRPSDAAAKGGPNTAVIVVGGVIAGLAAGAGVGFTIGAAIKLGERGDKPKDCTDHAACKKYDDAEILRANFAIAAITSYVVAGVFGAGTLTYRLVKRSKQPPTNARADLILGPGTAGGMITVHW